MLDPQLKAMFHGMVMPVIRAMPTDAIRDIQTYVNEEIEKELQSRNDVTAAHQEPAS